MKIFSLLVLLLIAICIPSRLVYSETLNLSTYYPAPFGAYDRLRLVPRADIASGSCDLGLIYSNADDSNSLYYCREDAVDSDGEWVNMGIGIWEMDIAAGEVSFANSDANDDIFLGIGDGTPDALIEISGSGDGDKDFLMISDDDDDDGDLFIMNSDGDVGIGETNPGSKLVIRGAGFDSDTSAIEIVDSSGNSMFFVRDDGRVSVGGIKDADLDSTFEVNGSIEIEGDGGDSRLTFKDPGAERYSMGVDVDDSGKFKINWGNNVGDADHFTMDSAGNVTIGGGLTVFAATADEGVVKVIYVDDAVADGYYATYAP